ncbi:MAG: class I SAM-dependent methyltransferase [Tumebacillaceae bacterium]
MPTETGYSFDGELGQGYDGIIRLFMPGYDTLFRIEEALLHTMLGEQAHVLIAGAGGGMDLKTFGVANPEWRLTGVDPSPAMNESALAKATEHGLGDRVELHTGFVHDLPADMQFDGAACNLVLQFVQGVEQKRALLQSIYDRLKPGGAFALSAMHEELGDQEDVRLRTLAFRRMMMQLGVPKEKLEAIRANLNSDMHQMPEAETVDLLRQVGFEKIIRFHTGLYMSGWVARKPQE